MSGEVVQRPSQPARHVCQPPVDRGGLHSYPTESVGTIWRCSCGKRWVVRRRVTGYDWYRRERATWVRKFLPRFGSQEDQR